MQFRLTYMYFRFSKWKCVFVLFQTASWELCVTPNMHKDAALCFCPKNTQTRTKSKLPKVFCERGLCSHFIFHHTGLQWTQASTHGNKYSRSLRGKTSPKPDSVALYWPLWGNYLLSSTRPSRRISEGSCRREPAQRNLNVISRFYDLLLMQHFFMLIYHKGDMN